MLDLAARLALSPLLAAQALHLRRHALRLPEARGPRSARTGGDLPALSLLILGDSSAAGVGAATQNDALAGQLARRLAPHYDLTWTLRAATGATTASTLRSLDQSAPARVDVVVTALGVNDATRFVPLPLWLRRQRALLDRITALHAPRMIYLTGMPPLGLFPLLPQPLRWTLGRQARLLETGFARLAAERPGLRHVTFDLTPRPEFMAEDGFHPSPTFYGLWADRLAHEIRQDARPGAAPIPAP